MISDGNSPVNFAYVDKKNIVLLSIHFHMEYSKSYIQM